MVFHFVSNRARGRCSGNSIFSKPEPWRIKQEEPEPEPEPCRIKQEEPEPEPETLRIKQEEPEPWRIKQEEQGGWCLFFIHL